MKRLTLMLALLFAALLIVPASAADQAPVNPRPATIGGGVKNPWSLPYSLAIVSIPEPTSLGLLGLGAAALLFRRRK